MATRTKTATTSTDQLEAEQRGESIPMSAAEAAHVLSEAQRIFGPADGLYTDTKGQPLSLYGRIARIIQSLPEVKPEGQNQHFGYKFVTDKQVLGLVRPRLAQQMIVVIPEKVVENDPIEMQTQRGGKSLMSRLHVTFRVVDGLDGEFFYGEAIGYGDDSGDKGANKAYTAALKNFFIKLFQMGGADRDIEDDPETDRRAKARESGVEQVQSVQVKETVVEGVARGGRSNSATAAQVQAVSRLVASLGLTPQRLAGAIEIILGEEVDFKTFGEAKVYLEALSGERIGQIIESLSEDEERREAEPGYGA